jgi:hypothetical protein
VKLTNEQITRRVLVVVIIIVVVAFVVVVVTVVVTVVVAIFLVVVVVVVIVAIVAIVVAVAVAVVNVVTVFSIINYNPNTIILASTLSNRHDDRCKTTTSCNAADPKRACLLQAILYIDKEHPILIIHPIEKIKRLGVWDLVTIQLLDTDVLVPFNDAFLVKGLGLGEKLTVDIVKDTILKILSADLDLERCVCLDIGTICRAHNDSRRHSLDMRDGTLDCLTTRSCTIQGPICKF